MTAPLNEHQKQTLVEHLTELRVRLVRSVWGILVGFGVCWGFSEQLVSVVRRPIAPYLPSDGLVFLGVMDKFVAHLKVAGLASIILTCPFWLYQLWKFIEPALYEKEKRYAVGFISFGSVMFITGVLFAYFLVYPAAFEFLLKFGGDTDKPMITLGEYLSFFVTTTLVFGLAFELPLILVILGVFGLITDEFLRTKRRYAVVLLAVMSAIVTPPDAISMMMLLVPMMGLYEISIILVGILGRKSKQERPLVVQPPPPPSH